MAASGQERAQVAQHKQRQLVLLPLSLSLSGSATTLLLLLQLPLLLLPRRLAAGRPHFSTRQIGIKLSRSLAKVPEQKPPPLDWQLRPEKAPRAASSARSLARSNQSVRVQLARCGLQSARPARARRLALFLFPFSALARRPYIRKSRRKRRPPAASRHHPS